jgi:signal recognition particle subunit SRP54
MFGKGGMNPGMMGGPADVPAAPGGGMPGLPGLGGGALPGGLSGFGKKK